MYELFLTAPFYAAIAYATGAAVAHLRGDRWAAVSLS